MTLHGSHTVLCLSFPGALPLDHTQKGWLHRSGCGWVLWFSAPPSWCCHPDKCLSHTLGTSASLKLLDPSPSKHCFLSNQPTLSKKRRLKPLNFVQDKRVKVSLSCVQVSLCLPTQCRLQHRVSKHGKHLPAEGKKDCFERVRKAVYYQVGCDRLHCPLDFLTWLSHPQSSTWLLLGTLALLPSSTLWQLQLATLPSLSLGGFQVDLHTHKYLQGSRQGAGWGDSVS